MGRGYNKLSVTLIFPMSLHTEPKKLIKQKNNSSTSVWVGAFETWRIYKKPLEKHQQQKTRTFRWRNNGVNQREGSSRSDHALVASKGICRSTRVSWSGLMCSGVFCLFLLSLGCPPPATRPLSLLLKQHLFVLKTGNLSALNWKQGGLGCTFINDRNTTDIQNVKMY